MLEGCRYCQRVIEVYPAADIAASSSHLAFYGKPISVNSAAVDLTVYNTVAWNKF